LCTRPAENLEKSGEACDRDHHSSRAAGTKRIVNLTLTTLAAGEFEKTMPRPCAAERNRLICSRVVQTSDLIINL
ncbi:hypothetical protein, partial [Bradyrhizobium sp. CCH5-F6]|uniref:hypothetical protein n=1 Tax=Bradyrhizobium sp. CCH5-F6 TaxID=1768753 RepID=UPI001AECDB62